MTATAKKASGGEGGHVKGPKKRPPKRRCELVPYKELECPKGSEAHHVVPDWMLRLGKRGGPGTDSGHALTGRWPGDLFGRRQRQRTQHSAQAHRPARSARGQERQGHWHAWNDQARSGQGHLIALAIEKATGGLKKGGCSREDIKKQLDEQFKAHDDALVRAIKHAGKVTDEMKSVLNPTGPRGK